MVVFTYTHFAILVLLLLLGGSAFFLSYGKKSADDGSWLVAYQGKTYVKQGCDNVLDRVLDTLDASEGDKIIVKSPRLLVVLEHKGGNTFNIKHTLLGKSLDFTFVPGREFLFDAPFESLRGRKMRTMVLQNYNVLTAFSKWTDLKGSTKKASLTHVFTDKEVTLTVSVGDFTSVCVYKPEK